MASRTFLHVLGAGSIGTLLTHHIRLKNPLLPMTLHTRYPAAFPPTLSVIHDERTTSSAPYHLERLTQFSPNNEFIRSLLICVKAPSTVEAIRPLIPRLRKDSVVTLLQNGMGVYDQLIKTFWSDGQRDRPWFIVGTAGHGVSSLDKGVVKHHTKIGEGDIKWGIMSTPEKQKEVERWLWPDSISRSNPLMESEEIPVLSGGMSEEYTNLRETLQILLSPSDLCPSLIPASELNVALLIKVAINAIVNPLTAILGRGELTNGSLLSTPHGMDLLNSLIDETSKVLLAHLKLSSSSYTPSTENEGLAVFGPEQLRKRVITIIQATAGNTSSMAVDIRERRDTEVEYINGYIVRLGKQVGIATPLNTMMRDMVQFISASHDGRQQAIHT